MSPLAKNYDSKCYVGLSLIFAFLACGVICASVVFANLKLNNKTLVTDSIKQYVSTTKGLYVWSHTINSKIGTESAWTLLARNSDSSMNYLAEFCKVHGIKEVMLFGGSVEWEYSTWFGNGSVPYESQFAESLQILKKAGIGYHITLYLNDDVNDLTNWENIDKVLKAYTTFNDNYNLGIISIHFDQEPGNAEVYPNFLRFLYKAVSSTTIPITTSMKPKWVTESFTADSVLLNDIPELANVSSKVFSDYILSIVDEGTIMAYSNDKAKILEYATSASASATRVGKKSIGIAIETGYINDLPLNETLVGSIRNDKVGWFSIFNEIYNQFDALSVNYHVIIHDYSQYFNTLYCTNPSSKPIIDNVYSDC